MLKIDQIYNFQVVMYQYLIYMESQVLHDLKKKQPNIFLLKKKIIFKVYNLIRELLMNVYTLKKMQSVLMILGEE